MKDYKLRRRHSLPGLFSHVRHMDLVDAKIGMALQQASDSSYEMQCTMCTDVGKSVEAVKHCVECDSNLCTDCLKQHNKFNVMKVHQLRNSGVKTKEMKLPLPKQRCELHAGKLIDVYCGDHDVVCCNTCVALDHRSCEALHYVPNVATHCDCKHDAADLEKDVEDLLNKLSAFKDQINERLSTSNTGLSYLKDQVQKIRDDINKHLDHVQQALENELDKEFQASTDEDEKSLKTVERIISNVDKYKNIEDKTANGSEGFVQVKMGRKAFKDATCLLQETPKKPMGNEVSLVLDGNIETVLKETTKLALVRRKKNMSSAKFHGNFNVKMSDETIPQIGGICQLNDNEILITDAANKKLKKLNSKFQVTSFLLLPACPCSVCKISDQEVAITMTDSKIQFVSVRESMVRTLSFHVGDRCRGIAYLDKRLYVCCGGHSPVHPGHVEVFHENGSHILSCYAHFDRPMNICADPVSKRLFITENKHSLVINKNCELVSCFSSDNAVNQHAICPLDGGNVFSSGYDNGVVSIFDNDGKFYQEVIKSAHNDCKPIAMDFNEKSGILIMSLNNEDYLKTFLLQ